MAESIWDENGVEWVRGTELAKRIGVGQAQINSLMKKPIEQGKSIGRIPEAHKDEAGYLRYPVRRCIVPTLHPRSYAAINAFFMTKEDLYNLDDTLRKEVMKNYWKEFGFDSPDGDAEDAPQESHEGVSQAEENLRAMEPQEPQEEPPEQEEDSKENDSENEQTAHSEKRKEGWVYTDSYVRPDRRASNGNTATLEREQTREEKAKRKVRAEEVMDKERLREQGIDLDAIGESDDIEGLGIVIFFRK